MTDEERQRFARRLRERDAEIERLTVRVNDQNGDYKKLENDNTKCLRTITELRADVERLLDALKAIECHSIDHTDACRMAGKARAALEDKP